MHTNDKGEIVMRIAIPCSQHCICEHFGKCERLRIYRVRFGEMLDSEDHLVSGSNEILALLMDNQVSAVLCNKMHEVVVNKLDSVGIETICGIDGDPDVCVNTFIEGKLSSLSSSTCPSATGDCSMCLS